MEVNSIFWKERGTRQRMIKSLGELSVGIQQSTFGGTESEVKDKCFRSTCSDISMIYISLKLIPPMD